MPPDLKALVEQAAHENGRSMNSQIVFMLARYFELEMRDSIRQHEVARDERIATADPQDLTVGDRILKEFNEQQTSMLMGLLVKHGVISEDSNSRDAMLKPLESVKRIAEKDLNPPRTPKIPGVNSPKEGLGAPPRAKKPRAPKPQISKKRVVEE